MKRFKKLLIIMLIISMVQSYFVPLYPVLAVEFHAEAHDYYTEVLIREGSELGNVVCDVLHGDKINLEVDKDYYLCIKTNTPTGTSDGFFTIDLGNGEPSCVQFINIPGQVYKPGVISSDAFEELLSFDAVDNPGFGSSTNKYNLVDGKLTYKIKEAKMNNNEIFMAFGFKIDETYWNNFQKEMLDFVKCEIGNAEGVQDSFSLDATVNKDKNIYLTNGTTTFEARAGVDTIPYTFTLTSVGSAPQLYEEIGYTITYPVGTSIVDYSFSKSVKAVHADGTKGIMSLTEEVDNGDGTISRQVIINKGQKYKDNINDITNLIFNFDKSIKDNTNAIISLTDSYYIPMGQTEKIPMKFNNNTNNLNITYKVSNSDKIEEKISISPIHRISTSNGAIYNWNLGREEGDIVKSSQMLCGVHIKNTDSVDTYYEKTIKANYNITNENINISMITVPSGFYPDGTRKTISEIRYTGYDADGNLVSGTAKTDKVKVTSNYPYAVFRAVDLGIVSFKSVESDIGKMIPGQYTSSWTTYSYFSSNLFAAYGYPTTQEVGTKMKSTFEIENTDKNTPDSNLKVTAYTEITDIPKVTYTNNITSGYTKENLSIVAGNSITLKDRTFDCYGNFSSSATDGVTSEINVNPEFILTLPKGISFSDLSFKYKITNDYESARNKTVPVECEVENISYLNTEDDGTNVYRVTFPDKSVVIGKLINEYLDNGQLLMTITYNTTKNVTTQVYDMNDLINITSETPLIASLYSNNTVKVPDKYGVNNGYTLGGSRYKSNTVTGLSLQRLDSITVDNAISIYKIDGKEVDEATRTWDTYDESNQNSIAYIGLNTEGQYRLHVQNPSSSEAYNIKMILPIPKQGQDLGTAFTQGENTFNMTLVPREMAGYSYKYITISGAAMNTDIDSIPYNEATAETANAILITKASVDAQANDMLYFDFTVNNDETVQSSDFNVFRNNFQYVLDGEAHRGSGNYVAVEVATCTVEGTVFNDLNSNGRKEANEPVIPNISIVATDSLGRVQFAKTDENGKYKFENVREDDVNISMEITSGAYKFNGVAQENGTEIYNNVTPAANPKKATASVHAVGSQVSVNASVNDVYTITYDKGAGTGIAPSAKEYVSGETAIIATPPSGMNVAGGEFLGWATTNLPVADDNATRVEYKAGDVITVTQDMTLYGVYRKKDFKVTFDYKGGGNYKTIDGVLTDVSMDYKYVKNGQQYRVADADGKTWPDNPTREGYRFVKWEKPNAVYSMGTSIGGGSTVDLEEDIVLRAVWIKLTENEDSVVTTVLTNKTQNDPFIELNGKVSVENLASNLIYGYVYALDTNTPLPDGMLWDDKTGAIYGNPTVPFEGDIKVTVRVKNSSSQNTYYDFPYTIHLKVNPRNVEIKNEVEPKGSILLQDGNGIVKISSVITGLVEGANLNENNKVSYKAVKEDGTEVTIGEADINADSTASIDWNVTSADLGVYKIIAEVGNVSEVYNVVSNNTINSYIVTEDEIKNYIVTFDPNGYGFEEEEKVYAENTQYGTLPEKHIDGYVFEGWFDSQADNAKKMTETDVITGDIRLYAKFTPRTYTVNYVTNIDTTIDSITVGYNDANLIPAQELVKTGYEFTGWSYENKSNITDAAKYKDLVSSEDVEEITLVANWKAKQYFVTFNTNGGSMGTSEIRVTYDEPYGEIEKPAKVGYDFVSWTDRDGNVVTKDSIYKYTTNSVLDANWTPKTGYTIYYNTNGGNSIPAKEATWETVALENIENPTKEGADFLYWTYQDKKVSATDTYATISKNDKYESITLNAVWDTYKYNVTLEQGTGFELINLDRIQEVPHGSNYEFAFRLEPGYIKGPDFKVTVNDEEVTLDENDNYTITNIKENKVVRATGVLDDRKATGAITTKDDEWTTKTEEIDFSRIYNTTLDLDITGQYAYGADPVIEYYVDSNATEVKDYETINWNPYNGTITLTADGKFVVYAKLTTENGAVVYMNTNGIMIDMTAPEIEGVEDGKSYCFEQKITVTDSLSGVASVTANGKELTLNAADNTYTVPAEGDVEITVTDVAGNSNTIVVEIFAEHQYQLTETTDPTCTVDGNKHYVCSVCKAEKDEGIEKLGHDFGDWYVVTEATEETEGLERRDCSRCDEFETRPIDKLPHEHVYGDFIVDKDATCTEAGSKHKECRCGDKIEVTEIPALGHDFGEWVVVTAATEEAEGQERRDCSRCDAFETRVIPKLDHVHSYGDFVTDKEPTCTEAGEKSKHCRCGDKIEVTEIPALGHDFGEWVVVTAATEEAEGLERRDCSRCDAFETRTIEKLPHTHKYGDFVTDKEATCTEAGEKSKHCACGERTEITEIPALGHDFGEWVVVTEATEETEGQERRDCSRCDAFETRVIPKLDHTHKYGDFVTDKEPTCTEAGEKSKHCECGERTEITEIPALGHDFGEWTIVKEATYTEDGLKTRECARCGKVEEEVIPKLKGSGTVDDEGGDDPGIGEDPENPTKPTDPTNPTTPENGETPNTGDNIFMYVLMMITSAVVLTSKKVFKFRNNK